MAPKLPNGLPVFDKVQANVPAYHLYVLQQLIGTFGTNESDVVAQVIARWIQENEESTLAKLGISLEEWRKLSTTPHAANVIELSAKTKSGKDRDGA
jgi:hypothetical protein